MYRTKVIENEKGKGRPGLSSDEKREFRKRVAYVFFISNSHSHLFNEFENSSNYAHSHNARTTAFSAQDLINIENLKKKRRKISVSRGKTGRGVLSGPLYVILRLPVMFFVGFFVAFELLSYVLVRFIIWVFECSTEVVDRKTARIRT